MGDKHETRRYVWEKSTRPEGTQHPRASTLSPIRTIFGHGLCNLCHHRIQLFCRCYSNGDVTCPYSNLLWQQGFILYKALVVPLICTRKVTQIYQALHVDETKMVSICITLELLLFMSTNFSGF